MSLSLAGGISPTPSILSQIVRCSEWLRPGQIKQAKQGVVLLSQPLPVLAERVYFWVLQLMEEDLFHSPAKNVFPFRGIQACRSFSPNICMSPNSIKFYASWIRRLHLQTQTCSAGNKTHEICCFLTDPSVDLGFVPSLSLSQSVKLTTIASSFLGKVF